MAQAKDTTIVSATATTGKTVVAFAPATNVAPSSPSLVYHVSPLPNILFQYGSALLADVAAQTISGLLRNREFLTLQLDRAWGNIDERAYRAAAKAYFATQEQPAPADLTARVFLLSCLVPKQLTAEALSQALGYKLRDVEAALTTSLEKWKKLSSKPVQSALEG